MRKRANVIYTNVHKMIVFYVEYMCLNLMLGWLLFFLANRNTDRASWW